MPGYNNFGQKFPVRLLSIKVTHTTRLGDVLRSSKINVLRLILFDLILFKVNFRHYLIQNLCFLFLGRYVKNVLTCQFYASKNCRKVIEQ